MFQRLEEAIFRFLSCIIGHRISSRGRPILFATRFQKCPLLQLIIRLLQLRLRVHDDWAIPRNGLLQGFPGHQQKANPILTRLHLNMISAVEENERAVVRLSRRRYVRPAKALRRHRQRSGCVAKFSAARKYIRESMVRCLNRQDFSMPGWNRDINISRIGGDALHRPAACPRSVRK